MVQQNLVFQKLQELLIDNKTYYHEPLFKVDQALAATAHIPGAQCKNLFLKDDKKKLYLIVAVHDTAIQLKKLSKYIQASGLRFADENLLYEYLKVKPGSVTPFGLIFDANHAITVLLDAHLFKHELVGFHPLENTATTVIKPADLEKFIQASQNNYRVINFSEIY